MTTETINPPAPAAQPKKRYEWIDNARVVAAILIMYIHWQWRAEVPDVHDYRILKSFISLAPLDGRVPFFLILAGYFLGRNITWKKAFDRALWLFIPFCILNYLFLLAMGSFQFSVPILTAGLGIRAVFCDSFLLGGHQAAAPAIIASWFLRDIVVLSLLTPLLVRIKPLLLVYIVFLSAIATKLDAGSKFSVLLQPYTCLFYFLGVCLSGFRISDVYLILNKKFTFICAAVFVLATCFSVFCAYHKGYSSTTMFGQLFGALMIAHSGVLIETYLPRFSKMLAPCGPACFLVFMLHGPSYVFLNAVVPHEILNAWYGLFIPIPVFLVIIAIFFLMKKYTPFLLPYLAHMKLPKKPAQS